MKQATAAQMREIERLAVAAGDTYVDLMERAGRAAARWMVESRFWSGGSVTIVCGKGNNGGDGYVLARHLCRYAAVTVVQALGAPATETAGYQYRRLLDECAARSGGMAFSVTVLDWQQEPYLCRAAVSEASVLVDCLFGIGFHGRLPMVLLPLLQQIRESTACKVAIDMPTGIDADTGLAEPDALAADYTLTFTAHKAGLTPSYGGEIQVLPIGIPDTIIETVLGNATISESLVAGCFSARQPDSHKGTYGRLLAVCGSYGMAGAALLCLRAALRGGAGLVTAAVPRSVYPLLAAAVPEAVFSPLPETPQGQLSADAEGPLSEAVRGASAVVIGPGLGRGEAITDLVMAVCRDSHCPVILDADGINAIVPHMLIEEAVSAPLILTPHPGEMARLLDTTVYDVQQHREEITRRFADEYGVTLALKGHHTLVAAPGRPLLQNPTGNPGMATGGSGDVLAGLIASLVAQGMEAYQAALCGVYLHGAAGDRAAARVSQHSLLPSDIIEELGGLFLNFEK